MELADNSAGDTVSQGFPADMKQLVVAGVGGGTFDPPSDGRGKKFPNIYRFSCTKPIIFFTVFNYIFIFS